MTGPDDPAGVDSEALWRGSIGTFALETVTLPNGLRRQFAILRHPGAAAVLPFVDDATVLLLRQYRHAAGGMLWEIPAGKLDPGEDAATCARRELQEETGFAAHSVQPLGRIHTAPGFSDEVIHLFEASGLTRGPPALEAGEIIEPAEVPLQRALAMIDSGEITDGKTLCALYRALRRRG